MIKKIISSAALMLFILILSSCSGRGESQAYIRPVPDEEQTNSGHFIEGSFSYRLPSGSQGLTVSMEIYENGKQRGDAIPLGSLSGEGDLNITADFSVSRSELIWFANENHAEVPLTFPSDSMVDFHAVMTEAEFEALPDEAIRSFSNSIVLACVGFSPVDEGIQPTSCASMMTDWDSQLSRYAYAQILRVYLPE